MALCNNCVNILTMSGIWHIINYINVEMQGGGGGGGSDILSLLGPLSSKLSGVSNRSVLHTVLSFQFCTAWQ
jgi:hypothetical protein